ncbi:MAG: hypothetical protein Ct9H300mP19_17050 [Dehalococcoidia bacterium]|nr:MAG: hypothetical protein Ct9H300mP19_17050 [Dehalococcoidia bacterium]
MNLFPLGKLMYRSKTRWFQSLLKPRKLKSKHRTLKFVNIWLIRDVVNTQRDVIYQLRDKIIDGEDLRPTISGYLDEEVRAIVGDRIVGGSENYDVDGLYRELMTVFPSLHGFPEKRYIRYGALMN